MKYKVSIQPSGHQIEVGQDESILGAALRGKIIFPYGCQSGVCGACFGKVLEGEVAYPDDLPMGLSEDDHKEGNALFCKAVAKSDLVIEVAEVKQKIEIEVKTLPCKVSTLRQLSHDVMEVTLKLPETQTFSFLAGQYINFILPDGKERAFSLASSPNDSGYLELHIRHVDGGIFTEQVFNQLKEKAILRIKGPLGTFFLRDVTRPIILMGGGTGFAPLKGMMEQIIADDVTEDVYLYWGVRTKEDLYLADMAYKWEQQYTNVNFIPVLSDSKEEDQWQGRTGFVHEAVVKDHADLANFDIYMSGPPVMVDAGVEAFKKQGSQKEQMYSDAFEFSDDALAAMKSSSAG